MCQHTQFYKRNTERHERSDRSQYGNSENSSTQRSSLHQSSKLRLSTDTPELTYHRWTGLHTCLENIPLTIRGYTFLPVAHGTFSKIVTLKTTKAIFSKYKNVKIIPCILSDHHRVKLQICSKQKSQKLCKSLESEEYTFEKRMRHWEI